MISLEDAVTSLQDRQGAVRFVFVQTVDRVQVLLPGWHGYFVERDSLIEAVEAAIEREAYIASIGENDLGDAG